MANELSSPVRLLIFGYGNIGRGDDAVGPEFVARITSRALGNIVCHSDMQLQIEHAADLDACDRALFIDADCSCAEPYEFSEIHAAKDDSYTSHAMSPGALLYAYQQIFQKGPPPAFVLRIRGYEFGLGEPLSQKASVNLEAAMMLLQELCKAKNASVWRRYLEIM